MDDLKALRAACEAVLERLPTPGRIDDYCQAISSMRGRPLLVMPMMMQAPASGTCAYGAWVGTSHFDLVVFDEAASPLHRDQIVLHEIAHMVLGHGASVDEAVSPDFLADFLVDTVPDLSGSLLRTMLQRRAYDSRAEAEAELLGSLILERANRPARNADATQWVGRLGTALQHPRHRRRARHRSRR
ncbi:hypothetical protein [Actinomadura atramentaria]|uniref:hypothetical protein n=1 Tax=Actinomadura atramentaria TaxID=1990 RepID=UPI00037D2E0B|nr:hypothetical protein [Actinomadura atramentaria]